MSGIPLIDLFAGAGGLTIGARAAGADVRLSVDLDAIACETLSRNRRHHGGSVLQADVTALSGHDLRRAAGIGPGEALLIVGGAPCQPFSKAAYWLEAGHEARYRQARARGEPASRPESPRLLRPDARRDLIWEFWRLVEEAQPDAFLFENVPSILHPRNRAFIEGLQRLAEGAGYRCRVAKVNAVEFGVPQRRHRVFLLASRSGAPGIPRPTHSEHRRGVRGTLPAVTAGEVLAPLSGLPREPEEIIHGRWAEHLRAVPPGSNYKFHSAWAHHPQPTFVAETRFWNFLLKLSPDLPSWTVAANPGPWTGPFHWDSRRLRTPELAALQMFPPQFDFAGNRRERVRQIGNAVPPLLAEVMVRRLIATTTGETGEEAA